VLQFLKVFVDIVLWRRGPQDLPSSMLLVAGTLIAYLLVSGISLLLDRSSSQGYFVFLVLDPVLLMSWIWIVLKVYRREARYRQTIAAILGASALVTLVMLLPLQVLVEFGSPNPSLATKQILAYGYLTLQMLVAGRIVKLATDSNLFAGVCVMAVYIFVELLIASLMTPGT
jgi:hypothetical protein